MQHTRRALRRLLPVPSHPPRAILHRSATCSGLSIQTSSCLSSPPASTSKAHIASACHYSSQAQSTDSPSSDSPSIFSPKNSPWDHVFEDIATGHPLIPIAREKSPRPGLNNSSLEPRRQTMTNRELSAFDEMFNMIFAAANERRLSEDGSAAAPDIDTRGPLGNFLKSLSKHPRARQTGDDTELDKLKEQLALCPSDHAMLEWAEREVFGASVRAEEAVRTAFASGSPPPPHLQPPVYPPLLAALMNAARESTARNLSSLSYIFGCTTPAYNELLETRWNSFRDLRGVHAALAEMRANGVSPDMRTRGLVDDVRRETGARTLWLEEGEAGSGEVWKLLGEIERLVARRTPNRPPTGDHRPRQPQRTPHDAWKNPDETLDRSAAYQFGEWPQPVSKWTRRTVQSS
ncbi:hypothetical protein EDB89DRAFT_2019418 [Lactarius sanguifluus]|nr:hypothetical protein EDB89DRAFT_2019418 [Lactarius sanguifluus]